MKRVLFLAALFVSLASSFGIAAQPTPDKAKVTAAAREVIKVVPFASFITLGAKGQANARIVQPAAPDEKFEIWIVSVKTSRKVAELRKDSRATLLYFDQATMAYVTLLGKTTIVEDQAEKEKHWLPAWDPFFPKGVNSPNLVLVHFVPTSLEIVSPTHKLMGDTWGLAIIDMP